MSDRLHVATRKGLFVLERGAKGWGFAQTHFHGDPVTISMLDPRDSALYAVLNHGHFGVKLHRSRDGGATWDEIASPQYPEKPEGVEDIDPVSNVPRPWKLMDIWALTPGGAAEPGVLWAGTMPGGLFRSADSGETWELNRPLWEMENRRKWVGGGADHPVIHSVLVHPQDSKRVMAGVSVGGCWATTDGGETWAVASQGMRAEYLPPEIAMDPAAQDPHIVVQCPAQPEKMWAQHHNGIFRTVDGGVSWSEIEEAGPSTFGFGAAVHPEDGDTAWFVPATKDEKRVPRDAKLVVTRTRDGGKSFDVLTNGLPQANAHDIVYRHALAIDKTGDRLAFGTTTGNLFVTDDQGDHWTSVTNHLPPVYAVSFA